MIADAVVIGAGFAGLSAASRLAEAGVKVVVAEEAPRLGGRAVSFDDRTGSNVRIDNGQHVLFGCYRETYAFLRRIGTADLAPLDRTLAVALNRIDGRESVLRCPRLPSPWHLLAGVLRWDALPFRDRWTALKLARAIREASRFRRADLLGPPNTPGLTGPAYEERTNDQTVAQWLRAHGQAPALCQWLWYPLAFAALNQSPDTAAAAPFVRVLVELFGPGPDASAIGLPTVPLDALYAEPAARFIEARGGAVRRRSPARVAVSAGGAIAHVRIGDDVIEAPVVISAVPWHALARIWDGDVPPALAPVVSRAGALGSEPIVTVNLWFDQPVMEERFIGIVSGTMHWAFNKGGASHRVSVVASGAVDLLRLENDALAAIAERDLRGVLPIAPAARVVRSLVVREPRATFSLAPGGPDRPGTRTAVPGFYLAGDWIDTGLPGTIESAVMSGHLAAAAVLAR
jgi:uncharacterized protein with NAD-binding domain and iron-sulfur cluster